MLVTHLRRFVVVGLISTGVAYLLFTGLLRLGVHYLLASAIAWAISLAVGFALNRRYTFDIRGPDGRVRNLALYVMGALGQLALGSADYALMIGKLGIEATPAFIINTAIVATASFIFSKWVTFRRPAAEGRHV